MTPIKRQCRISGKDFVIDDKDQAFYKERGFPLPTLCPEQRLIRRLAWRNDTSLYHRKCDETGQDLITMFRPDSPVPVVHKDIWWSEEWDGRKYAQEIDWNRPFFEQFHKLSKRVPRAHIMTVGSENSLYTNYNGWNKNCYMCFAGNTLEDSYYCYNANRSKDCCDCLNILGCELCYECVECQNCTRTRFGLHSKNCHDCWFIEDCENCENCIFSSNLRRKKFHIFNKEYSEEEYFKYLDSLELNTPEGLARAKAHWEQERWKTPKRANQNKQVENCSGEYIYGSRNCHDTYGQEIKGEDCRYGFSIFPELKDAYDCSFCGEIGERFYECMATGDRCYEMSFCDLGLSGSQFLSYCSWMVNCQNCFGCVGLRNNEYCIFNKQYSKEEYEKLLPKLIDHMRSTGEYGEFFPAEMSPFKYEESKAQEFFPKPGHEHQSKPFKVIQQEKDFYQKLGLPEPTQDFMSRHLNRQAKRNGIHQYEQKCAKTGVEIHTSYSPESPAIVYSEEAYANEVY